MGAELAIDAIEDGSEFLGRVGINIGAAGGVGHGLEGVLAGGVAAAFVFHRADDDGVKEGVGTHGFFAAASKSALLVVSPPSVIMIMTRRRSSPRRSSAREPSSTRRKSKCLRQPAFCERRLAARGRYRKTRRAA